MIPTGLRYTATLKGSVLKLVACEDCGAEYVYTLQRTATGQGHSPLFLNNAGARAQASQQAEVALRDKLQREADVVPCPACGHVQEHMLPLVRKQHRRWMLILGAWLFGVSFPIFLLAAYINAPFVPGGRPPIPWLIFLPIFGGPSLIGIGLIVVKFVLASRYDPNREDEEARMRRGRERACLRAEWETRRQRK